MKIKPLFDQVVVSMLETEETTKSGIVLPSTAKEKTQVAEILAVGPGGLVDGKDTVMQVKAGEKVIIRKYAGTEVKVDDKEVTIVSQKEILAVVE